MCKTSFQQYMSCRFLHYPGPIHPLPQQLLHISPLSLVAAGPQLVFLPVNCLRWRHAVSVSCFRSIRPQPYPWSTSHHSCCPGMTWTAPRQVCAPTGGTSPHHLRAGLLCPPVMDRHVLGRVCHQRVQLIYLVVFFVARPVSLGLTPAIVGLLLVGLLL